ncbi:protein phosphatase 2C domain-containing protein [Bacillus sp. BHET2]|uniref:protein phosphatase 2C domain-containing protein n=1 Tax=Bacillus sp. BHET2 TaxID=2583818 RepID=UPI00110D3582|nr:protein phosphatase 2C domain-containing protein [Bacillus sp. BHET2]TMU87169.1 protein phosphatase 2C domain-containing protein [Bacillus sp. BHET2]
MTNPIREFSRIGSQTHHVDNISIHNIHHITLGRFGGNSAAGQYKNEDGCLIWTDVKRDWEFVVILDAHHSAESAELVINHLLAWKTEIQSLLSMTYDQTFKRIEETILRMFQEETFLSDCRRVQGETACLIVLRKNKYLWWFSIGDCLSYLFHSDLAQYGQFQINQRQFYEWVGQVNTFNQVVPCYSSGIRELRKGMNRLLLTTDGLVESPNESYSNPKDIYNEMECQQLNDGIRAMLKTIQENNVRDSTTIIAWDVNVTIDVTVPSDE